MPDIGSGYLPLSDYVPADCNPSTGPAGGNCTSIYVSTVEEVCLDATSETCKAAAEFYEATAVQSGFPWGIILSIIADVVISIGLALQKVAHNKLERQKKEARKSDPEGSNGESEEEEKPNYAKEPVWWAGLIAMICGEVGNFVAYGDVNTPASVVIAVGCVGVIANAFIATYFLGEKKRLRDAIGGTFVIIGVTLVVVFAPQQTKALSTEVMVEYLTAAGALTYLALTLLAIGSLYFLCPRFGHKHVLWNLTMASLIGSLTVMASKAVSTFLIQTLESFDTGPIFDQVDLSYGCPPRTEWYSTPCDGNATAGEARCLADGHTWGQITRTAPHTYGCITVQPAYDVVNDTNGNVIVYGLSQHDNPFFYLALLVLVVTAIAQVKYINLGMSLFGNSEVIPTHYVTFTLFSILGTSIVYQEFNIATTGVCPRFIDLHLFLDGCFCTFAGVWLITSGRANDETPPDPEDEWENDNDALTFNGVGGGGEHTHKHTRPPPNDPPRALGPKNQLSTASLFTLATEGPDAVGELPTNSRQSYAGPGLDRMSMTDAAGKRHSMAERYGLPDGGIDARARRDSRASSVSTFLSVLGGGQTAAFLFDPTDHTDHSRDIKVARSVSISKAREHYPRSLSISHDVFSSMGIPHAPPHAAPRLQGEGSSSRDEGLEMRAPEVRKPSVEAAPAL